MEIKNVAVAGAGTMGNGIAHVFAAKGFNITLLDTTEDLVKRGVETIRGNLARQVKKGLITEEEQNATMSRIKPTTDTRTLSSSHLVIEAIFEDLQIKNRFWSDVDKVCPPEVIFASNTSSLPITQIAAATSSKDKIIGMHFMNPVPLMKLVEVIRGMATSDETCHTIENLCLRLEKTPVEVNDYPGFVANRILMPMINEAIFTLMEGVSSRDEIDTVMKLGANHPMGPLTLADFIGLDVCLAIMETLYEGYSDSKYRPCPLLRKMVQSGWLGRKTKKGFYDYE
jgi:3-hydroxybutyryl-CoA dehydrogenase